MELWDEELGLDVHGIGIFTLPEMELPFGELEPALAEIGRVARELLERDKFLVMLGGEHSITAPAVEAAVRRAPGLHVLQIDAHADLRDQFMGSPFNHACAMRRVLDYARGITQVGIRSLSAEEAQAIPALPTTIFHDFDMRRHHDWIDRVVESLGDPVYITIDCDGFDPALMPAVGTPEPGGLSWYEMLGLLRAVIARRAVIGCDLVELAPLPGIVAPNFLCAKLIYKILTYRFGAPRR
jgi:agmatinase